VQVMLVDKVDLWRMPSPLPFTHELHSGNIFDVLVDVGDVIPLLLFSAVKYESAILHPLLLLFRQVLPGMHARIMLAARVHGTLPNAQQSYPETDLHLDQGWDPSKSCTQPRAIQH